MDRSAVGYAERLQEQQSPIPETIANTQPEDTLSASEKL